MAILAILFFLDCKLLQTLSCFRLSSGDIGKDFEFRFFFFFLLCFVVFLSFPIAPVCGVIAIAMKSAGIFMTGSSRTPLI